MKKIYAILLALSALSIVLSGCSKPADENANPTPEKDKGAGTSETPK